MRKGIPYGITGNAKETPYDNSKTGLDAENVQEAVDKLSSDKANQNGWTPNMILGTDANGKMVARATYTEAEKRALIQEVVDSIKVESPSAHVIYGDVDANNVVTLFGDLPKGSYTLQYEDENGNVTKICDVEQTVVEPEKPNYTNVLPLAIGSDGKAYNGGQGWKTGTRLNSSGAESTSNATDIEVTGFMPVKNGDTIYLKDVTMNRGEKANLTYFWLYDSNFTIITDRYKLFSQYDGEYGIGNDKELGLVATDENENITMIVVSEETRMCRTDKGNEFGDITKVAYFRISCEEINDNSIITVNEPIV